jgi:hypothetical protein
MASLVDHLVGGCEERFRHLDARRPRRLPVDDEQTRPMGLPRRHAFAWAGACSGIYMSGSPTGGYHYNVCPVPQDTQPPASQHP